MGGLVLGKQRTVIRHLTEGHLNASGGYPYDWTWVRGLLVVARNDVGKDYATAIVTYDRESLCKWFDATAAWIASEYEMTLDEAVAILNSWGDSGELPPSGQLPYTRTGRDQLPYTRTGLDNLDIGEAFSETWRRRPRSDTEAA